MYRKINWPLLQKFYEKQITLSQLNEILYKENIRECFGKSHCVLKVNCLNLKAILRLEKKIMID